MPLNATPSSVDWTVKTPAKVLPVMYNQDDMTKMCRGITRNTVRDFVEKGLLPPPSVKSGKIWLWPEEVWDAWVAKKVKAVR